MSTGEVWIWRSAWATNGPFGDRRRWRTCWQGLVGSSETLEGVERWREAWAQGPGPPIGPIGTYRQATGAQRVENWGAMAPTFHWDIIGGKDKGGILVREGESTKSPESGRRLDGLRSSRLAPQRTARHGQNERK